MQEETFLFDDYFDKINLNDELLEFYKIINDEDIADDFIDKKNLTDIRNKNFNRYLSIDISLIENLPFQFDSIVNEIKKLYSFINKNDIVHESEKNALETQKILDSIDGHFNDLNRLLSNEVILLENTNNVRQERLKQIDYSSIDKTNLSIFLNKYNNLILFNATIEDNLYDNYRRQLKRKKYLNELYRLINIEIDYKEENNIIEKLNNEINNKLKEITEFIIYLEDLMISDSDYLKEFTVLKNYFKSLKAYDDKNYTDVYRVYNILLKNQKIGAILNYFEESFIKEIDYKKREEKFIFEKYGIKNIKTSINYISSNYMDMLNAEEKSLIEFLYDKISLKNYNLNEVYNRLKVLTNNIWKRTITDVYEYNINKDFNFICTNNQFIDEKHQAILISKRMIEKVTDYTDYQIGFICGYNDNLLYITENSDIMSVNYNDMSNLKTPKQIEQEFVNFKVCNRIALNGYMTKISAVYFIDDGDKVKYKKSVELSNQYKLPLIVIKKDKN